MIGYLGRQPDRDLLFFFSYLSFCRQYTSIYALEILRGQRKKLVHAFFDLDIRLYQEGIFPYPFGLLIAEATKLGPYFDKKNIIE